MAGGCCGGGGTVRRHNEEWNSAFVPFFEYLTGKDGIKTKEAIEVGAKSCEYFRGSDFYRWIARRREMFEKEFVSVPAAMGLSELDVPAVPQAELARAIGTALLAEGFIVRVEHRPIAPVEGDQSTNDEDNATNSLRDNPKWPRRVGVNRELQTFDNEGFFMIMYEPVSATNYLLLGLIIVAVLCACLFPIWPFRLKVGVWYLGVSFGVIMLMITILRLVVFVLFWFGGCDFWLIPKFFDEDAGVIDSFIPLYTFSRRKDDWLMVGARCFAALLSVGLFYKLSETHSFADMGNVASRGFLDILDWGHQKLADAPAETTVAPEASAALSAEEKENLEWESCVKHCEFADFEEFKDFCYSDCECMTELWGSNCWKRCPTDIQEKLRLKSSECTVTGDGDDEEEIVVGGLDGAERDEL